MKNVLSLLFFPFLVVTLLATAAPCLADSDSDSDSDSDRTLVGTWSIEDLGTGNWFLGSFHHGGTGHGAAWSAVWSTGAITWKKAGPNRYLATHFVMFPDANPEPPDESGYVKDLCEYWLIDDNTLEGRSQGWWVAGNDPLGPIVFGPLWEVPLSGTRLEPEEP